MAAGLLALLMAVLLKALCATTEEGCELNGIEYHVGQRWHPYMYPWGIMHCINCTCKAGGHVDCKSEDCPRPTCDFPVQMENKCCPVCQEDLNEEFDSAEDELAMGVDCEHAGQMYSHGSQFPSTHTALTTSHPNQCVQCACLDGEVLCHLKTCLVQPCGSEEVVSDQEQPRDAGDDREDCCPPCQEGLAVTAATRGSASNVTEYQDNQECYSREQVYAHGESWNPEVGHFGRFNCVVCRCKHGEIHCKRLRCPADKQLPCDEPRASSGLCCKVCPSEYTGDVGEDFDVSSTPQTTTISRKLTKKSKRRSKLRTTAATVTQSGWQAPCLTKKQEALLLHGGNSSHLVTVMFYTRQTRLLLYRWGFRKKRVMSATTDTILNSGARETMVNLEDMKMKTLGALSKSNAKKLEKKLNKQAKRCRENRCKVTSVNKLLKRSRTQKVKLGNC